MTQLPSDQFSYVMKKLKSIITISSSDKHFASIHIFSYHCSDHIYLHKFWQELLFYDLFNKKLIASDDVNDVKTGR